MFPSRPPRVARLGVGPTDLTIAGTRRMSTAATYLREARSRPSLEIVTGAFATRLLFQGTRATGVEICACAR
ncbi:GMC family oxidoreductase N-terminal domain-containing protein [Sphingobium sp. Cam5-1]|nr:GMC family oxidoreductase N-terminal domain-containing protein [Sphingobium sp. Cam5-1]